MDGEVIANYPQYSTVQNLVETVLLNSKEKFLECSYTIEIKSFTVEWGRFSRQFQCVVEAEAGPEKGKSKTFFLKSMNLENSRNQDLQQVEREVVMYLHVISQLLEFVRDQKQCSLARELMEMFPRFVGYGKVDSDVFIVLEDFGSSRHVPLNVIPKNYASHGDTTVILVMRRLAQYHGALHALTTEKPSFIEQFPLLQQHPFFAIRELRRPAMISFVKMRKGALKWMEFVHKAHCNVDSADFMRAKISLSDHQVSHLGHLIQKVQDIFGRRVLTVRNLINWGGENVTSAIPILGDCHQQNIACSSQDVLFFDLQLSCFTDGLIDLHTYLATSTTPKQHARSLPDFLQAYFTTLTETCTQLGMSVPPYTDMDQFMDSYRKLLPWQLLQAYGFIPRNKYSSAQIEKLIELADCITDESWDNFRIMEIVKCFDKLGLESWETTQLLLDYLTDLEEQGMFEELEKIMFEFCDI